MPLLSVVPSGHQWDWHPDLTIDRTLVLFWILYFVSYAAIALEAFRLAG